MPLAALIDKEDNFEIIRNEIAAILALETLNQQNLATLVGKDPKLWEFKVFVEKSRPFESLDPDDFPLPAVVNVSVDNLTFAGNQSMLSLRQTVDPGIFNIDILSPAVNLKKTDPGYISADRQSMIDCQRIVRLIRNILYSVPPDITLPGDNYPYLNLKKIVGSRKITTITMFPPKEDNEGVMVAAARIQLEVKFLETGAEGPFNLLELLQAQTEILPDGEVIFEFDLTE